MVGGVASNVSLLDQQLQIERLYWQHKVRPTVSMTTAVRSGGQHAVHGTHCSQVGSMQGKLRAVEKVRTHMIIGHSELGHVCVWQENCKMRKATEKLSTDYCHLLANYVVGRAARTQTHTNLKKTEAK